jgi:hypothetical protein
MTSTELAELKARYGTSPGRLRITAKISLLSPTCLSSRMAIFPHAVWSSGAKVASTGAGEKSMPAAWK